MNDPLDDADAPLSAHVAAIRNRYGIDGLKEAQRLIALEIELFDHAYDDLRSE
jgi:hypothetical protein